MGRPSRHVAWMVASLLAVAACSGSDQRPDIVVDAQIEVCAQRCVLVPAAGASYELTSGGRVVSRGRLGSDGSRRISDDLAVGEYSARVSMPGLGLEAQSPVANASGTAVTELSVVLPRLDVLKSGD